MAYSYKYTEKIMLDRQTEQSMKALQNKYSSTYYLFFKGIADEYSSSSKRHKELNDMARTVKQAVSLIDGFLLTRHISKKDRKEFSAVFDEIEKNIEFVREEQVNVKAFGKKVKNMSDKTGITSDSLNVKKETASEVMSEYNKGYKTNLAGRLGSLGSRIQEDAPELHETAQGLVQSLGNAFLGPFSGLAGAAFSGASGLYKGHQRRKREKRQEALSQTLTSDFFSDEAKETQYKTRRTGAAAEEPFGSTGGYKKQQKEAKKANTESIFNFWDKEAGKAKYTKRLLEKLGKVGGKEDGKKSGLGLGDMVMGALGLKALSASFGALGGVVGKLASVSMPLLIQGAAIAGAAMIGFKTGQKINSWIDDNLREDTETGVKATWYEEMYGNYFANIGKAKGFWGKAGAVVKTPWSGLFSDSPYDTENLPQHDPNGWKKDFSETGHAATLKSKHERKMKKLSFGNKRVRNKEIARYEKEKADAEAQWNLKRSGKMLENNTELSSQLSEEKSLPVFNKLNELLEDLNKTMAESNKQKQQPSPPIAEPVEPDPVLKGASMGGIGLSFVGY